MKIAGLVVGVVGVALVGTGIAFGVLAKQAGDDLTALNNSGGQFDRAKEDAGLLNQTLSGVMLGVGAAAVVTGVVVGVLGVRQDRRSPTHAAISPLFAPGFAGASASLSF